MSERIITITPANDWTAVCAVEDEHGAWHPEAVPLACWALIEDSDGTAVVGLVADDWVDNVEDDPSFIAYAPARASLDKWQEAARDFGARQAKRHLAAMCQK